MPLTALTASRWATRVNRALREPRTALPVVFISAGVGLSPLAVVSAAAGVARQSRRGFTLMCLTGRAALATPIALATAHT